MTHMQSAFHHDFPCFTSLRTDWTTHSLVRTEDNDIHAILLFLSEISKGIESTEYFSGDSMPFAEHIDLFLPDHLSHIQNF